ncbi:type I-E CRISPR-associated protein Cas6/Cse3/CasE [Peptococcus simiae]|uniref:Type I-E CRISPR-associated protein Cas6/Cse3/CasE n=1 Tax=Peptococcus simiae TaxID=1643805 RepID=A0ABW9GYT1_9FIRM
MYLSRVEIDLNNRQKMRDLTHLGAYHNWVEESFPAEMASGDRSRKLWRVDTLNDRQYLLLVSQTAPDLQALEKYGLPGTAETKSYDDFLASLKAGQRARFRVTLNPVMSKSNRAQGRGRVMPHVTADQQAAFLLARAEKNGFNLEQDAFTIVERGYGLLRKKHERPLRLIKTVYEGVLTITDADQFRQTLTEGFGKKKAYGFGMMTIIPLD